MKLNIPPKRIIRTIPLNDYENNRFLKFVDDVGSLMYIERFLISTGMYLRGRLDGDNGSRTKACGYIFLDKLSFEKCHRQIGFFNPPSDGSLLEFSFRRWNNIYPFSDNIWNKRLDAEDKAQPKMRVKIIANLSDLEETIELAVMARDTFSYLYDLTISRVIK